MIRNSLRAPTARWPEDKYSSNRQLLDAILPAAGHRTRPKTAKHHAAPRFRLGARNESAPGKFLPDSSREAEFGRRELFCGARRRARRDATPVAEEHLCRRERSVLRNDVAVVPSNITPSTPLPGPPVATPPTVTKSTTPKKPKKKSLLKTLSSPIKSIAKKVSPQEARRRRPSRYVAAQRDHGGPRVAPRVPRGRGDQGGASRATSPTPSRSSPRKLPGGSRR